MTDRISIQTDDDLPTISFQPNSAGGWDWFNDDRFIATVNASEVLWSVANTLLGSGKAEGER